MAKISTYPLEGNPKLSDKLIGTSVGLNPIGNLENPTYNFSLQQLLNLFSPLLPGNTLQGVLDNNNTATQDINLFGKITTTNLEVTNIAEIFSAYISDSIYLEGELFDVNNSQGILGQILTSTGSGVEWITPPNVIPTLQQVLTSGNESDVDVILTSNLTALEVNANLVVVQNGLILYGVLADFNESPGTSGQMLISTGTGVLWQDVPVYTASSPLFINPATKNITIQQANGTQNGYLSFADWITFDGKQDALSGTGIVVSNGGIISYITDNSYNWNRAYNDSIISAAVTGTTTKTLTLTQRDGDVITASWSESGGGGGISSIGLTMPSAFTVTNSPLTANGTIAVTAAGTALEYIKGDGTLGTLPSVAGFVPYTGATADVDLGLNDLTANAIIKNGGTSSQFLKADGSVDTNSYITLLSLFALSPLSYSNTTGTFSIQQSSASQGGFLSAADWITFNNKQNSGNYITGLTGEATASGPGSASVVLSNAAVIAKVLTGLNVTGGSVISTDTILQAFGKLQNQINSLVGGSAYQGTWNAFTNTPALTSGVGTAGYYYIVNVAGSTNLDGITDWKVGDWAIFDGTVWQKVDNTDAVSSVNGYTGAVNLVSSDIPEGLTNLYFTDTRSRLALSFAAGSGAYNNTTGVITIPTNNNQILNGAGYITSSALTPYLLITTAASTYFPIPTGTISQYIRGDGSLATFPTITSGTVTSVGLSMPSAFTVSNSPITGAGTIAVTGAGLASQYIRGDGSLATFPSGGGGGASVSYYLNGSISQGTIGGAAYKQLGNVPVLGAGTDFTINADGYIAQFITDIGNPNKLVIPAGNWNFETYFSASSGGGSPQFYIELYKYNGTTFTLIASNSATPENITGGTNIDLYFSALSVPETVLLTTDRLAVRFYVIHSGRTITMQTENSHLSQVITTFSTGLTALNGLTAQVQYLAVGTAGTDFNISSATDTHTLNLPTASALNRGALSSADWNAFNSKFTLPALTSGSVLFSNGTTISQDNTNFFWDDTNNRLVIGFNTPINNSRLLVVGDDYQITLATTNGLTGIFCADGGGLPMILFDNNINQWSAFNGYIDYDTVNSTFLFSNILVSDIGGGINIGAYVFPNQTSYTTNNSETLIGVKDVNGNTLETGLYLKRGISCEDTTETTLLEIASPNSTVDCVIKIGYLDKYFIAKLSLIIDWDTEKYTYKIIYTNTTNFDNAEFVNDLNFTFDFPPYIGSNPLFAIKLNNNTGDDIYANINANIL